ncbi:hypothetical protein FC99_GL000009 [Levilactobacillus koreensis JCM 16448]|nr:Mor transcription activator family protein [Levilactobacillus koreensis]KRK90453.1 hypothetical protein FC99_GL000009 [Levilactobacillus koreensis JCM 16448]
MMDDIQNWQALYQELARLIGPAATRKLCAYYGGAQISFPRRLLDQQREAALICQEYAQGVSVVALARRHNYSSRTIRRILAKPLT